MNRILLCVCLMVAVVAGSACDEDTPTNPSPQNVDVNMTATTFSPSTVSVAVGGTVRWVNATATAHTITPATPTQTGVWVSVNVPAQNTFVFSHTFNTAGTYNYLCTVHAGMSGTINVN